jgi:hypothetical protein
VSEYRPDYCNNDFLQGLNDGGAGHPLNPEMSEVTDYRRGWHEGRDQYDEFMKTHGFVSKALTVGIIGCSAVIAIWAVYSVGKMVADYFF